MIAGHLVAANTRPPVLPALIVAGDRAALCFLENFTVSIRRHKSRAAYARAAVAVCAGANRRKWRSADALGDTHDNYR
jgi:hypothetical protein